MPHLPVIPPQAASGLLHEVYQRTLARPLPPVYRPLHGGAAGIIVAHSLDPQLLPLVFGFAGQVNGQGPLTWPQRELVNTVTSRLNQYFY